MSIDLLTEEESRVRQRRYVLSRKWWVIPWVSGASGELSQAIEERFYGGTANKDFELHTGGVPGGGLMVVSFGRKARMTPEGLAALLTEKWDGAPPPGLLEGIEAGRDVLLPYFAGGDSAALAAARLSGWMRWLGVKA